MSDSANPIKPDPMLVRLKLLPPRLRLAHLAALLRNGRVIVRNGCLSYPSPRAAVGREGRRAAEARVGGLPKSPGSPHPDARFTRVDPPRKGEGLSPMAAARVVAEE